MPSPTVPHRPADLTMTSSHEARSRFGGVRHYESTSANAKKQKTYHTKRSYTPSAIPRRHNITVLKGKHGSFVVVVVLTLTRIIKSVVTGQAPVTQALRNTQGKTHFARVRSRRVIQANTYIVTAVQSKPTLYRREWL